MGRLITFMARLLQDVYSGISKGIACDEGTALLVDNNGIASITSWFTNGSAYFLKANNFPLTCQPDTPLSFINITVNKVFGNDTDVFDMNSWELIEERGTSYVLNVKRADLTSTQTNGNIY